VEEREKKTGKEGETQPTTAHTPFLQLGRHTFPFPCLSAIQVEGRKEKVLLTVGFMPFLLALTVGPYRSTYSRILQFHRDQASDSGEVVTPFMQDGTYPTRNFATLGPY